MVVDTSAVVAILLREPEADQFNKALTATPVQLLSAITRAELYFVIEGRKGEAGRVDLERLLQAAGLDVESVTPRHAEIATDAFRRYGKGRHRAGLNTGDCFSYALATAMDHELLFKGHDYIHTDIRPALPATEQNF